MDFLNHIIVIIIIWLTVTAQPDNNTNYLIILRNNLDEILNPYDFAKKLKPSYKLCVLLVIFLPSLLSG